MYTDEIYPIPHEELKEHFPRVFENEFETRKIVVVWDRFFKGESSYCWATDRITQTTGKYTLVICETSKGERQEIHFWKTAGGYNDRYKPKYCYSRQKDVIPSFAN